MRKVPTTVKGVSCSCKIKTEVATVITGTIYMYRLVFTAPSFFMAKFHVTKQSADTPTPKYKILNRYEGFVKRNRLG